MTEEVIDGVEVDARLFAMEQQRNAALNDVVFWRAKAIVAEKKLKDAEAAPCSS